MDGLAPNGLRLSVAASSAGVLSDEPASSSGSGEKVVTDSIPKGARSRDVLDSA